MKTIWGVFLAFFFALISQTALAQISDINSAINKAGRERMLSQRMAKVYLQIGQGVDLERSKKILDTSVGAFDRQLVELKNYAPTPEIKNTYLNLEKLWIDYKDYLVGKAPSQESARKLMALSEEMQTLTNQGVSQFEKHGGAPAGRLVNHSGRLRMLSQRMAKLYQAAAWGVGDANTGANIDKARKEFGDILKDLNAAPNNTSQIKDGLELIKQQWFFFENAVSQKAGDKRAQLAVATTSERILEEIEIVVGLYEKQPK